MAYVGERKQFGRPIGDNQYLQFKLAEMATSLVSARCVILEADRYQFRPSTVLLGRPPSLAHPPPSHYLNLLASFLVYAFLPL